MKVSELFGRAGLSFPPELGEIHITNIVTDSRRVTDGSLFLCLKGEQQDGHRFMREATERGAKVIVAEQVREQCVGGAAATIPRIVFENTRQVAALLYNVWCGEPTKELRFIGVTGTNGKTSVTSLLCKIFNAAGKPCGLVGTVGIFAPSGESYEFEKDPTANMTTPDPGVLYPALAWLREQGAEYVVMEVSSHALAQGRVAAIDFHTAVFTNLTRDHLDYHKTMEAYYQAKRRLFSMCQKAVLVRDSATAERLAGEISCPKFTVSLTEGDFCPKNVESLGLDGTKLTLQTPGGSYPLLIGGVGEFSLINGLTAAAVAWQEEIPMAVIGKILAADGGVKGRLEPVFLSPSCPFRVFIDYAHTPDALEKLIKTLLPYRQDGGRLLLLFGCGGDRDRSKRAQMGRIASAYADEVIVTSDNCRTEAPEAILGEILKGMEKEKPHTVLVDRRDAIAYGVNRAGQGDILVLAGKGHETYEIQGNRRLPFDEREILREAWSRREHRA